MQTRTVLCHSFRRRVFSFISPLPCCAPVEKFAVVKCAPQTAVDEVTLKCCPTSHLIAVTTVWHTTVVMCIQLSQLFLVNLDQYLFTYCHSYSCPFWHAILLCNWFIVIALDVPTETRVIISNEKLQNLQVYVQALCLGRKGDSTYKFDKKWVNVSEIGDLDTTNTIYICVRGMYI